MCGCCSGAIGDLVRAFRDHDSRIQIAQQRQHQTYERNAARDYEEKDDGKVACCKTFEAVAFVEVSWRMGRAAG
jgi:hypothetical protein